MNRATLAKALRRRQLKKGYAAKADIQKLSDEEILLSYMECSQCQVVIFANSDAAVRNSATVAEFIDLVNMALAAHRCANRN